ncbi:hypothetical protein RJ641_005327 [Dillenia turbinata]|uniref:Uncharacterized protein n=1 Tax=Dillenia turbinata TaxID=194707 RepID=A0AAN8VGS6_9MAGN
METEGLTTVQGSVACASWIRRPENAHLVVVATSRRGNSSPAALEIFSYDSKTFSLSSSPMVFLFLFHPLCVCVCVCLMLISIELTCVCIDLEIVKATYVFEEGEGDPLSIAVHPTGDDFVCSTSTGVCKYLSLSLSLS